MFSANVRIAISSESRAKSLNKRVNISGDGTLGAGNLQKYLNEIK